jgi:hypothetical protein
LELKSHHIYIYIYIYITHIQNKFTYIPFLFLIYDAACMVWFPIFYSIHNSPLLYSIISYYYIALPYNIIGQITKRKWVGSLPLLPYHIHLWFQVVSFCLFVWHAMGMVFCADLKRGVVLFRTFRPNIIPPFGKFWFIRINPFFFHTFEVY